MKIRNMLFVALVGIFFVACGGGSSSDTISSSTQETQMINTKIDPKYYGAWAYVYSGERINIISTTDLNLSEVEGDDNLLKENTGDTFYYLIRSSLAKTKVKGKVEVSDDSNKSLSPTRRSSYSGIASINIILSNVLDENINEETVTDSDGSFNTTGLPSGTYKLKASDSKNKLETTVSIENQENDIGVYKLTGEDLYNFKAELIIDDEYILSNGNLYEAILRIHNISDNTGYGLSYDISLDSNESVKSFTEGSVNAMGSVVANSYKDIPVSFSFNKLSTNMKEYGIDVTIKDALGNQWADTFSFNVSKELIAILIATKSSSIKGYIKSPLTGRLRTIDTADGKILVPLMPADKPYMLVLSNPSIDSETAYSIGVNTLPESFETFKDTHAHEPNNIESQSTTLNTGESTISYLHATDIDYWKIYTKEDITVDENIKTFTNIESPRAPSIPPESLVATDGDYPDKIEVSWTNNSIATYFELYESTNEDGEYRKIADSITQTVYTVDGISDNLLHYYKVKGCNDVGCSSFSDINSGYIGIINEIPIADAGEDQTVDQGAKVVLDASKSSDKDGTIESYVWIEEGRVLSEESVFTTSSLGVGIHRIALVVTDNAGATNDDIVFITVNGFQANEEINPPSDVPNDTPADNLVVDDFNTNLEWDVGRTQKVSFDVAAQRCEDSIANGLDDWRLPSFEELESLYNLYKSDDNRDLLIADAPNHYWSTTRVSSDQVKSIYFTDGSMSYRTTQGYTEDSSYFKCVRVK